MFHDFKGEIQCCLHDDDTKYELIRICKFGRLHLFPTHTFLKRHFTIPFHFSKPSLFVEIIRTECNYLYDVYKSKSQDNHFHQSKLSTNEALILLFPPLQANVSKFIYALLRISSVTCRCSSDIAIMHAMRNL